MTVIDKPMPDSDAANALGCKCPISGNGVIGKRGVGVIIDGVTSRVINPQCAIHADPKWWMPRHQGAPK